MYKTVIVLLALLTPAGLHSASASAGDLEDLLTRGDSLYSLFDYKGSAALYREASRQDSSNFESLWKLGRSLNLEGEMAPKDSQLAIFEEARDAENRAIELNDNDADAHFELARAIGKIALFKGVFKSVGLAKRVRKECLRALELDSLHDGAWHILGRWNREVGKKSKIFRIPLGLGAANKKDAIAFMQKAIEINPTFIHHHLEMGITYMTYKKDKDARVEFEKCLELPAQRPLDEKYKSEAEKYLAELNKS